MNMNSSMVATSLDKLRERSFSKFGRILFANCLNNIFVFVCMKSVLLVSQFVGDNEV